MVLEAIGAFALACNILQVVECGAKIVGKAGSLHRGETAEIDDTYAIAQQLSKLNKDLSSSVASTPALASPLQTRLTECNVESLRLSQKFIDFVQNLSPKTTAPQCKLSRAESFRSAIRLKWHQEEIKAMQNGLSQAKSNLIVAFLLYMHSKQASNSSQEAILTASNRSERNMLAAIGDTSDKLHSDITGLMQQMSNVKIDESTYETLFAKFQASHADALSRLALGIESILLEQQAIRNISDKKRAEIAQKRIYLSLSFRDMDSRQNQIREAHEDTYHWILSRQNTTDVYLGGFQAWLDSPTPVHRQFWVSGKPGSGKSTLMQYLDQNIRESCCTRWLSGHDLFICRFFLWNPGRGFQKSFQGLLQAFLYQFLFTHQWLIEAVVSEEKWSIACAADSELNWSILELKILIEACLHRISTTRKILLLVDGLDELEGTDDDRHDMLNFLRKLTDFESVKLCVSSRPWNIFSDHFHKLPQLQLQLFTRTDIDKYVRHSLSYSMHLQSSYLHNSGEGEKLIEAIVDKASGVFLWVHLVVQELLRGFRDGETIRTLKRKVDSMPADLNGFFRRIIDSIDPPYRREGSAFLQTALFTLQDDNAEWPRGLLEFTFLEAEDADFIARPGYDFTELDLIDLDALQYRIDLGKRRLNSRCMGLLEWANSSIIEKFTNTPAPDERLDQLLCTDVNFLHRSLMDFLLTADAQNILHQCTDGPFQAQRFLCSATLTKVFAISVRCWEQLENGKGQDDYLVGFLCEETDRLLRAVTCSKNSESASLNVIMNRLNPVFDVLRHSRNVFSWHIMGVPRIVKLLKTSRPIEDLSIRVAIEYNLINFVKQHLTERMFGKDRHILFLDYALHPMSSADPCPEMVSLILEAGVNLNEHYPESGRPSIWWEFLGELPQKSTKSVSSANVQIMELMIKHNADTHCPVTFAPRFPNLRPRSIAHTSLTEVLDILNITDTERCILKSMLRDADEAKTFNSGNAALEKLKPKKRKQINAGGSKKRRKSRRLS